MHPRCPLTGDLVSGRALAGRCLDLLAAEAVTSRGCLPASSCASAAGPPSGATSRRGRADPRRARGRLPRLRLPRGDHDGAAGPRAREGPARPAIVPDAVGCLGRASRTSTARDQGGHQRRRAQPAACARGVRGGGQRQRRAAQGRGRRRRRPARRSSTTLAPPASQDMFTGEPLPARLLTAERLPRRAADRRGARARRRHRRHRPLRRHGASRSAPLIHEFGWAADD